MVVAAGELLSVGGSDIMGPWAGKNGPFDVWIRR